MKYLLNMKMTFRPSIKKTKKKFFLIGAFIALLLIVLVSERFSFGFLNKSIFYLLRPVFDARGRIINLWQDCLVSLKDKKDLQDENFSLRGKISELETKNMILSGNFLKSEDGSDQNILVGSDSQKFLTASVIFRPPQTPYDMLIIDSGSNQGIKEGMQAIVFGNILLGYVAEVFPDTSKVELISSFHEETNVVLESSNIPAIAVGLGGENFEIILPRPISVNLGERIIKLGNQPLLVGIVEKIENQNADPFQKIIFRLPLNIQYLKSVSLLKTK